LGVDGGCYDVTIVMLVGFKKLWMVAATKRTTFTLLVNALATI